MAGHAARQVGQTPHPDPVTGHRERPRLAVAGCGRVFERYHLPALRWGGEWQVVAVCDLSPERRAWAERACPGTSVFESLSALLDASAVDAVLVASSPVAHAPLVAQALAKGLHVLVEKPFTLDAAEARAIVLQARRAGRQVWVGFNRRFHRPFQGVRDRLAGLPAERLRALHAEFISGSAAWRSPGHHLGDEARGGGILDDIASHQIDLLPWLVGRPVADVRVVEGASRHEMASVRYELRFDSGLIARCRAVHGPTFHESVAVELGGRTLWADSLSLFESRWLPRAGLRAAYGPRAAGAKLARILFRRRSELARAFETQLSAFAAAVRDGAAPCSAADAASGLRNVEIIRACRESRDQGGRWVAVAPIEELPT